MPLLGEPLTRSALVGVVGVAYGGALGHRPRAPVAPAEPIPPTGA